MEDRVRDAAAAGSAFREAAVCYQKRIGHHTNQSRKLHRRDKFTDAHMQHKTHSHM